MIKNLLFISFSFVLYEIGLAQKLVIDTVCFNTSYDDYGVRPFNDELVVVSAKSTEVGSSNYDNRFGVPYSDVFRIDGCSITELTVDALSYELPTLVNSSLYDAPISFSKEEGLVFFSNNSDSKNQKLGIFYSKLIDNQWSDPMVFPLNSESYNVTHPFFDDQTKRLYYASDFEKGKNKYDIYYSDYNGKDWSRPVAVAELNSDSVECFPYVRNGNIYFTSNNSKSVGGLDLFVFQNGLVMNMGDGFNSTFDDICLSMLSDTSGFFSSNRGSLGKQDDVLAFHYEPIPPVITVIEEVVEITPPEIVDPNAIMFDFDSYKLLPSHQAQLNDVVNRLKESEESVLVLSGHTDNVGPTAYNKELSRKRAMTVKNYLVKNGINSDHIQVKYYGLEQPIETNETEVGRQMNRRVEFQILREVGL